MRLSRIGITVTWRAASSWRKTAPSARCSTSSTSLRPPTSSWLCSRSAWATDRVRATDHTVMTLNKVDAEEVDTRHSRLESSRNLTWTHPCFSVSKIAIYLSFIYSLNNSFIYFVKVVRLTRQKFSHRIWDILQHVRLQKAQQKQFSGTEGPFQRNGKVIENKFSWLALLYSRCLKTSHVGAFKCGSARILNKHIRFFSWHLNSFWLTLLPP